jgi:hypothetical protein
MTLEQTMHTLESHLEALQAEYDRLLEEKKAIEHKNNCTNQAFVDLIELLNKHIPDYSEKIKLGESRKANMPMYKGEYNNA